MSQEERRLADTTGRFLRVVADGDRVEDPGWTKGRILLSNRRLILVGQSGKRTLPLSELRTVRSSEDVARPVAQESRYTSLRLGDDVLLVSAADHGAFEEVLSTAVLEDEALDIRHPADADGSDEGCEWAQARAEVVENGIRLALSDGSTVELDATTVTDVRASQRTVGGETQPVVEVEHAPAGSPTATYIAASPRSESLLRSVLQREGAQDDGAVELDAVDREVLTALYSGVSPFAIPQFTGVDVEEVEETFERLIDRGVLDQIRLRREVALTPRGRNLASQAIGDE